MTSDSSGRRLDLRSGEQDIEAGCSQGPIKVQHVKAVEIDEPKIADASPCQNLCDDGPDVGSTDDPNAESREHRLGGRAPSSDGANLGPAGGWRPSVHRAGAASHRSDHAVSSVCGTNPRGRLVRRRYLRPDGQKFRFPYFRKGGATFEPSKKGRSLIDLEGIRDTIDPAIGYLIDGLDGWISADIEGMEAMSDDMGFVGEVYV